MLIKIDHANIVNTDCVIHIYKKGIKTLVIIWKESMESEHEHKSVITFRRKLDRDKAFFNFMEKYNKQL